MTVGRMPGAEPVAGPKPKADESAERLNEHNSEAGMGRGDGDTSAL